MVHRLPLWLRSKHAIGVGARTRLRVHRTLCRASFLPLRLRIQPGPRALSPEGRNSSMRTQLDPQSIAVNRVHALALEAELTAEFSKAAWREAHAAAMRRWREEGHAPERIASTGRSLRKPRYTY